MRKLFISILCITIASCALMLLGGCTNTSENDHVHSFTIKIIDDKYLASSAKPPQKARYYYACSCGEIGTETFEYGEDDETPADDDKTGKIEVKTYIDGEYASSIVTNNSNFYLIAELEKSEDITKNPSLEKYFDGWYLDPDFQTPLTEDYKFTANGNIYARNIPVYFSAFKLRHRCLRARLRAVCRTP